MARLMHQLRAPDLPTQFLVLKAARERITQGGPARLKHTIPPIAFAALQIVRGLCGGGKGGDEKETEPVSLISISIAYRIVWTGCVWRTDMCILQTHSDCVAVWSVRGLCGEEKEGDENGTEYTLP